MYECERDGSAKSLELKLLETKLRYKCLGRGNLLGKVIHLLQIRYGFDTPLRLSQCRYKDQVLTLSFSALPMLCHPFNLKGG